MSDSAFCRQLGTSKRITSANAAWRYFPKTPFSANDGLLTIMRLVGMDSHDRVGFSHEVAVVLALQSRNADA